MRVACPDCTNPIEAEPGEEVVCPACMATFMAPQADQVPRRFDVHFPDGSVLSRQSSYAVREAIYTGTIPITARLRPDVGSRDLVPVYAYPWFGQIYALLGVEPPAHAGTRRIAGWVGVKKAAAAPSKAPAPTARARVEKKVSGMSIAALLAVAVGGFFFLLVLLALLLAW